MRLIDADELKEKFLDMGCLDDKPCYGAEILDRMPTVCDIEQIREEIQHLADLELLNMKLVLQIIDKHTKGDTDADSN